MAPDGSWLAVGGVDGESWLIDLDTNAGRELAGHRGPVNALVTAPDGSWLATASADHTARIWDTDIARVRNVKTARMREADANIQASVSAIAAAPDGRWLATANGGRTVHICDVATGRNQAILSGTPVDAVAISPRRDLASDHRRWAGDLGGLNLGATRRA